MSSEVDTLIAKVENLEEKLKSSEDNKNKEVQEKEKTDAKKATFKAALENMDEKQKAATLKSIKAQDDEDMKKIANDYEDKHMNSKKSKKAMEDDDKDVNDDDKKGNDKEKDKLEAKVRNLTSRISDYETTEKTKIMTELVALKSSLIANLDEDIYKTKLSARTFAELKAMVDDRKDEFLALKAAEKQPEQKHFGFSAKTQNTQKLTSASSILSEGGIA